MSSSPLARPPPPFIKPSFQSTGVGEDDDIVSTPFFLFIESDSSSASSSSSDSSTTTSSSGSWNSDRYSTTTSSSAGGWESSNSNSTGSSASGSSGTQVSSVFYQRSEAEGDRRMGGPLDMTVPELMRHWAAYRPDRPALIFRHPIFEDIRTVLTYKDLYTLGGRCANLLKCRGVRRESVLLVLLRNSPERAIIEAAAILMGAFTVTATCKKKDGSDLVALVKQTYATGVILDIDVHTKAWEVLRGLCQLYDPGRGNLVSARFPDLHFVLMVKRVFPPDEHDFICFLREVCTREYTLTPPCFPSHPCVVLSTARGVGEAGEVEETERGEAGREKEAEGTDGEEEGGKEECTPIKLVVHTHKNIVAFSKIFMPRTDSPRPMYFLSYPFGNVRGHLAVSLCNPVTRILLDDRGGRPLDLPGSIYKALSEEQCPIAVLPPSVIRPLAQIFESKSDSTFRLSFLGFVGEAVSSELLSTALQFSHMAMVSYVSSELLTVALDVVSDPGSQGCGQVLQPGVFIDSTDQDGNKLSSGQLGYLQIRTPLMFKKYLHDPKRTVECFAKDGFFKTGDLGHVLDKYLYLNN